LYTHDLIHTTPDDLLKWIESTCVEQAYLIGNGQPVNLTVNDIGETLKDQYDLSVFDLSKGFPDAFLSFTTTAINTNTGKIGGPNKLRHEIFDSHQKFVF
jgi:hypothetical protein